MQAPLIIEDVMLGTPKKTRPDEDLAFWAPDCLNDLYKFSYPELKKALQLDEQASQIELLHAVLPYVAIYYDLDRTELLASWVKNYGMAECFG